MSFAIWTAILAASPFGPYLVLGPIAPGLGGTVSYSVVMMLLVSWHWLGDWLLLKAAAQARVIKSFVYASGKFAALLLALIGILAIAISCQMLPMLPWSVIDPLISVGSLLRVIATFSWCLYAESQAKNSSTGSERINGAPIFLMGCAWPAASTLASVIFCAGDAALCSLNCALVLAAVLLLMSKKGLLGHLPENTPQLLISGHLLCCFYLELQHLMWSQQITSAVYTPQALTIYLAVLAFSGIAHVAGTHLPGRPHLEQSTSIDAELEHDNRVARACTTITKMSDARLLTERELTVLARTALGESATSIASALGIAEATVASYRRRGYTKLGVAGAFDLRSIVADTEQVSKDSRDCQPPVNDKPEVTSSGRAFCIAITLFLLVMFIWPDQIHIVAFNADRWVNSICRYALYAACSLLLLLGIIRANRRLSDWKAVDQQPMSVEERGIALGHYLLYAAGIAHAWSSALIWADIGFVPVQYIESRIGIVSLLLLVPALIGREELCLHGHDRAPKSIIKAISIGINRLASMGPENYFFLSASLFLSEWLESNNVAVFINMAATIRLVISILIVIFLLKCTPVEASKPACSAAERAVHYLMGRGLGELQSKIMIDLVRGYSRSAICKRNNTTSATVSSYRARTLKRLGLTSIDDLRELLKRETGFTR